MPDLIFIVAFIAMVAAPAMVATLGGRKEYNPGPDPGQDLESEIETHVVRPPKRPAVRILRPMSVDLSAHISAHQSTSPDLGMILSDQPTLPIHNGRGMANR